jgi:hypothetical protein
VDGGVVVLFVLLQAGILPVDEGRFSGGEQLGGGLVLRVVVFAAQTGLKSLCGECWSVVGNSIAAL